jgi:hypothetical protein
MWCCRSYKEISGFCQINYYCLYKRLVSYIKMDEIKIPTKDVQRFDCPCCGECYIHQKSVQMAFYDCYVGCEMKNVATIGNDNVTVNGANEFKHYDNGSYMYIVFECETCSELEMKYVFAIRQHKGCSMIGWVKRSAVVCI